MTNNLKTPDMRFKGYTDTWEQRKLGDITSLITKGTTPKDKSGEGEINFVKVENIDSASGEIKDCSKISYEEHEGYLKRSQLKENDILFSIAGTLGRTTVVNKGLLPANTNQALAILRTDEGDISYIVTVLKGRAVSDFIRKNPTVGAQPNLSLEQVSNIVIPYPKIDEQVKIGEFFHSLDNLITLHQRKYDMLVELKKSMLEKMFPKEDVEFPEIRFEGFTAAWEQRKLGDAIGKLTGGVSIAPEDYTDDGFRTIPKGAVNSTGIADMSGCKYVSKEFFEKNISNKTSSGELVTSLRDLVPTAPNMGRIVRICGESEDFLMPQGVYSIVEKDIIDEDFLIAYSNSSIYRKIIMAEKNGSTQVHIRNGEFLDIEIPLPKYEEQRKIGATVKNIDKLITLHQHKLERLKDIKKSMLEKMFVN